MDCCFSLYMKLPDMGPKGNTLKPALVVVTGFGSFLGMLKTNAHMSTLPMPFSLFRLDPLLVCMLAALFTNHWAPERDGFREILHDLAPLVMPPFFTIVGSKLDVDGIMENIFACPVLFIVRFVAVALGSYFAARATKQTNTVRSNIWLTLQAQSGVTLGLVAQMQLGLVGQQPWAKGIAGIIIGCVVMNQLVGPTMCRYGIRNAGESYAEEEVGLKQAFVAASQINNDTLDDEDVRRRQRKGSHVSFAGTPDREDSDHRPLREDFVHPRSRCNTNLSTVSLRKKTCSDPNRRKKTLSALSTLGGEPEESEMMRTRFALTMVYPDFEEDMQDYEADPGIQEHVSSSMKGAATPIPTDDSEDSSSSSS